MKEMWIYRTRTYIAVDFEHDKEIVNETMRWNTSKYCELGLSNTHDLESCCDTNQYYTIKDSLRMRM